MARRITTADVATQQKTINPYSQPCFTTYACNHSHGAGYYQYDHNMQIIAADHGTGSSQYGSFRSHTTTASEFFESSNSYSSTQSNEASSSNGGWYNAHLFTVGYLGHLNHGSSSSRGGNVGAWLTAGRDNGSSYRAYAFRDCVPIVGETHQDYALFYVYQGDGNQEFLIGQRSATQYYHLRHHQFRKTRSFIPREWDGTNYRSTYCGGCYNKKQNKFLITYTTSDGFFKPVIYENTPDFRKIASEGNNQWSDQMSAYNTDSSGEVHDFFNNTANATTYDQCGYSPYNSLSSSDESRYRPIPILCDNGKVVICSMNPGWGASLLRWNANGTYESGGSYTHGMSWTTSYGIDQGHQYGGRWQVSSDGRYLWFFCAAYYYGCGMQMYVIRVSDGKYLRTHIQDSSHGRHPFPIGKCSMGVHYSANTDGGAGMRIRTVNLDEEFALRDDGDQLNIDNHYLAYHFEPGTYSTSYGTIVPCMYDTSLFSPELPHVPSVPE